MNELSCGVYTTTRPSCSYVLEYDETMETLKAIGSLPLQHPIIYAYTTADNMLVFLTRCPILSRSILCVMRIQIPDLSCLAFVCCPNKDDLDRVRDACKASHTLLRASPLGLMSIIYEQRGLDYEAWVTKVSLESHEVEIFMKMAPPGWIYHQISASRQEELSDTDKLLARLQSTDIEICHGNNILSFAVRYGDFCKEALDVVESRRGIGKLAPGARAMVEDRIRFTKCRCTSVKERFEELSHRHRGQINAVGNLLTHILS